MRGGLPSEPGQQDARRLQRLSWLGGYSPVISPSYSPAPNPAAASWTMGTEEGGYPLHLAPGSPRRRPARDARRPNSVDGYRCAEQIVQFVDLVRPTLHHDTRHLPGVGLVAVGLKSDTWAYDRRSQFRALRGPEHGLNARSHVMGMPLR
jgi:hypothetical protein